MKGNKGPPDWRQREREADQRRGGDISLGRIENPNKNLFGEKHLSS